MATTTDLSAPEFVRFRSSHTSGADAAREVARHQRFTAQPVLAEAVVQTIAEDGTPMTGDVLDPVVEFTGVGAGGYTEALAYARARMVGRPIGSRAHWRVVTVYQGPWGPVFTL